jgi:hypothetical protein
MTLPSIREAEISIERLTESSTSTTLSSRAILRAFFIALLGAHLSGQLKNLFRIEVFGVAEAFRQRID